jgi:hypothetical protein
VRGWRETLGGREAIAVGNLSFVEELKIELGFKAAHPDSGWFKPFKPFNR